MKFNLSVLFFLVLLLSCKNEKKEIAVKKPPVKENNYLIEIDEFQKIARLPKTKIIDFRKPKVYAEEHIKGAINIWRTDIEDASYPYKGMMANKEQIETLFSRLGIHTNDILVVYDDNGLCDAARLWWVLQNYDYTNVKLLHGGLEVWKGVSGETTKEVELLKKADFKLSDNPSFKYYLSKEEMLKSVKDTSIILDTRSIDEFSGKYLKKGASKAGRIPASKLIDWASAIDYHGDRKIKSVKDLEAIYKDLIPSKEDTVFVYCHSGVRSAHTTFVLTQLLKYKNVKNYDGSWVEWSYFNNLPFEKNSVEL